MIIHSVVPALGNKSRMRRDSRSTSEFKESHTKQYSKMKREQGEFENWRNALKRQSKANALITDLQKTDTFNPFREEFKKINHNLGNVELLESCEVSAKTQCASCAEHWPEGVLSCICGQCLLPSEKQRLMTKEKFDCQYPTSS